MRDGADNWQGDFAHNLLLFAGGLKEAGVGSVVYSIAKTDWAADDDGLHARMLQAILYSGHDPVLAFWREQLERNHKRFAPYVFAGLRRYSLQSALSMLNDVDLSKEMKQKMALEVRALLQTQHDKHDIRRAVEEMDDQLSADTLAYLNETLPEVFG